MAWMLQMNVDFPALIICHFQALSALILMFSFYRFYVLYFFYFESAYSITTVSDFRYWCSAIARARKVKHHLNIKKVSIS